MKPPVWFHLAVLAFMILVYWMLWSYMESRKMTGDICQTSQARYLTPAQLKQCEDVLR